MASDTLYLGIDYGGTAIKLGLVDAEGNLVQKTSLVSEPLKDDVTCKSFASDVEAFVCGTGANPSDIGGVGLAVPGIVANGIGHTPNVDVDWALVLKYLQSAFSDVSMRILNDANAAALGEMWKGAGKDADSVLLVTLGTGVGSGFVVDGRVVAGGHGAAGEVGHLTVVSGGRPCNCGRAGCVEQYASARGVVQTYRECVDSGLYGQENSEFIPEHDGDAFTVCKAARANDPCAKKAFTVMAEKLGFALAQVACVVDPAVILLGGGLSAGCDVFLDELIEAYKTYSLTACAQTPIRCASLMGDAGMFGAARFAMIA